jgi:hypothetical protein
MFQYAFSKEYMLRNNNKDIASEFILEYLPKLNYVSFASNKPANKDAIKDLYLLKNFNKFILSNSTLHCWGACLLENLNIVITGDANIKNGIAPKDWILQNV